MSDPTEHSDEPSLPFRGEFHVELEIGLFGQVSRRKVKIDYEYSPEWDYWDVESQTERPGSAESSVGIHVLADPRASGYVGGEDAPYWLDMAIGAPGILSYEQEEKIYDLIEADARRQDRRNRELDSDS